MKPDWKDAPEWANWLAMDLNGMWRWHDSEPVSLIDGWFSDSGRSLYAGESGTWRSALERRPQTTKPAEAGSEGQGA